MSSPSRASNVALLGRLVVILGIFLCPAKMESIPEPAAAAGAAGASAADFASKWGELGYRTLYQGPTYQTFERPLPEAVEASLFTSFEGLFNQTQAFSATGSNTYTPEGSQFVVAINGGSVTGILGTVYNAQGKTFFDTDGKPFADPSVVGSEVPMQCSKHFKRLATPIQKYAHMYFHFMQEVLPRIILLRPYLDADTKVLVFGAAHELQWLQQLGISAAQLEVYDPSLRYCAEELLVPSLSSVMTPPRENYELVQSAFLPDQHLPPAERDLIIYCSRGAAGDRHVSNEPAILSAIQLRHPDARLHVYTGAEPVPETIQLFRRAKVVLGIHGAGLSHTLFSAPGTVVLEFLFMSEPPMMFWHAAAALRQRYVMLPLPQSWWLQQQVHVPEQDVLDALALALGPAGTDADAAAVPGRCPPGQLLDLTSGDCTDCPLGTYRSDPASPDASCVPCAAGRAAPQPGSSFCATCPLGTYAYAGVDCLRCPGDTSTAFPGSASASSCMEPPALEQLEDTLYSDEVMVAKLVQLRAFEEEQPKAGLGGLLQWLSPGRLVRAWRVSRLKQGYLEQLLDDDEKEQERQGQEQEEEGQQQEQEQEAVEEEEEEEEEETVARGLKATGGYRRHLASYRRHIQSTYSRRMLGSYSRHLASYSRHMLNSANRRLGSYSRHLGTYSRHLSSYSRHLGTYSRHLSSYSRHLSTYSRHMLSSANRHLGSYSRHLSSYSRHLGSYSRHMLSSANRHLGSYSRHLSTYSRHLSSYSRHLSSYSRRMLGSANRHLSTYSRHLSSYSRHLSTYSRHMLGSASRHLGSYSRHLSSLASRQLASCSEQVAVYRHKAQGTWQKLYKEAERAMGIQ